MHEAAATPERARGARSEDRAAATWCGLDTLLIGRTRQQHRSRPHACARNRMNHTHNLERAPTRRCSALRDLDRPRVAAGVLKTHGARARQGAGQPLRPLDRDDGRPQRGPCPGQSRRARRTRGDRDRRESAGCGHRGTRGRLPVTGPDIDGSTRLLVARC